MIRSIALKNLRRSSRNVRTTAPYADIECLAADIEARGVLQNLVVVPATGNRAMYEVTGGGRRLAALHLLLDRGAIDGDYPVPCLVRKAADAEEDGLAENIQRVEMHAADQYVAFARLIDQGKTVEEVAARFGLPQRAIKQRLKLGRLSPRLLDLFREGKLTQEHCEAFSLTDDHAEQEKVYEALSVYSHTLTPHQIRHHLLNDRIPATSKLGKFVRDFYVAAGLPVTSDLFAEDGVYLDDRAGAVALAMEALQRECDRLVQSDGWAWAQPLLEYDHAIIGSTRRASPDEIPVLSEKDAAHRLALVVEHNTILTRYRPDLTAGRPGGGPLTDGLQDGDGDEVALEDDTGLEDRCEHCDGVIADDADDFWPFCCGECAEAAERGDPPPHAGAADGATTANTPAEIPQQDLDRMAALKEEIAALDATLKPRFSPALKANAGCWVLVGSDGALDVREGYVQPTQDAGADKATPRSLADITDTGRQDRSEKRLFSASLATDLAAHRTQAFQVALANDAAHAKSYLLYTLWTRLHHSCRATTKSTISAHPATLSNSVIKMNETPAAVALAAVGQRFASLLRQGVDSEDDLALFQAIHSLSGQDQDALLAYLVAQTVAIDLSEHGGERDDVVEYVGQQINADPARWWRPTASEFFGRVPKAYILSGLSVLGRGVHVLVSQKKAPMIASLEEWFRAPERIKQSAFGPAANGDAGLAGDTVQAIQRWLPEGMAFAPVAVVEEERDAANAA